MKKIFLFDSIWSGHHPTYFKYFIKYILELGYQVYAFCPDPDCDNKWVSNNVCSNKMFNDEELKSIKKFKEQKSDNCFFNFKYIPGESKVNAIIELCDIIFAAYIKFPHSSNLLTKSAFFKKSYFK